VGSRQGRLDYLAEVSAGLRDMLRAPRLGNPTEVIRSGIENREKNFLDLVRRVIFSNPENPFHRMFQIAGCAFDDLSHSVARDGLDSTLAALHRGGVWLSHDEFKLKKPIVRSNQTIPADETSFRNPLEAGGIAGSSGGSRSKGTKFRVSTAARVYREAYDRLAIDEFGLAQRRYALLKPILPAVDGMANMVRAVRLGCRVDAWFSPVAPTADSAHYRYATYALVGMARMYGTRLPWPVHLPRNDFSPVARWISSRQAEGLKTVLSSYASPAVRVAAAAAELRLSLDGALFLVGGETLTTAKRAVIESAGAQVFTRYSISEFGAIGHACRHMTTGDSVHLFSDTVAAIGYRREAPFSNAALDSLLFTSLHLHAPHVLINVEMDDSGVLEPAPDCGCVYAKSGFTTVIRDISSFGKLTGHGVTLVGTDILRIIEHALPARFGGSATDYQLLEYDGADQAKLALRVSRRINLTSVGEVKDCFLSELRGQFGGQLASRLWRDANAIEVIHQDPVPTARGKILPLHLLGPDKHE
jgi:hypothetical protein